VNRYALTLITLLGVVSWLFFSYAPPSVVLLPPLTLQEQWPRWLLQLLGVVSLILFVGVQGVILFSTLRFSRVKPSNPDETSIKLSFPAELFWAALPLVLTLGLAALSLRTWGSLASP
jgi:heme/copper-type cytochrome/quinol oxidase subunit 2